MFRTRNKRLPLITAAFGILLSILMSGAQAGDIEKAEYDKGFGARDAAVRASHSPRKVAEFSGELLESAKLVKEDQPYQAYLFNKSYEIGMLFPEGIPFAVEAMDQLGNAQPQLKGAADANLLNAMQRRYQTSAGSPRIAAASAYIDRALQIADSLAAEGKYDEAVIICDKARIALAASAARHNDVLERTLMFKEQQAAASRIAALKVTLKTTPHDAVAAGELVQLLMLESDAPDQAFSYVDAMGDAKLKKIVTLAAKDIATLTDTESLGLADWYRGQTIKAGKLASYTAWSRAKLCYQHFLDTHSRADADRLNATRAMKDAEASLEKLPHPIGSARTREYQPAQTASNVAGSERIGLFDGRDLSKWHRQGGGPPGFVIVNGYLEARDRDIETVETFEDFRLHLEFATSDSPPGTTGQGRSNSGVFLQGRYEIQILDSFGVGNFGRGDCGAIWGQMAPTRNLSRPPGQWQTYDIEFHAAIFAGGGKTIPARLTLVWNDEKVLDDVKINGSTPLGYAEAGSPGPIRLQYQGSPVRFRNIWLERIGTAGAANSPSGSGAPATVSGIPPAASRPIVPSVQPHADVAAYLKRLGIEPVGYPYAPAGPGYRFQMPLATADWSQLLVTLKGTTGVVFVGGSGTDEAVAQIAKLPTLRWLYLNGQPVTNEGIAFLDQQPSLEVIQLYDTGVTGECIRHLATIHTLTYIGLNHTRIRGPVLKPLMQCRNLAVLDVGGNQLTDEDIAELAGHPTLEDLSIGGTKITSACADSLLQMPSLRRVDFFETAFGDEGVTKLSKHGKIESLLVARCPLGHAAFEALPQYKHLQILNLENHQEFSDADMANLVRCEHLEVLEVGGRLSGFGDATIAYVSKMRNLKKLDLRGTRVTDAAFEELKRRYPNVVFIK